MAGKRIDSIQGYRFLLFLSVFLFHCGINWFSIGWGVQFFLVLSSYFLTNKLIDRAQNTILSKSTLVILGNWSYVLYLFHFPIIVISRFAISNPWVVALISLPLTILATYLWHKCMEQKVIKLIGK